MFERLAIWLLGRISTFLAATGKKLFLILIRLGIRICSGCAQVCIRWNLSIQFFYFLHIRRILCKLLLSLRRGLFHRFRLMSSSRSLIFSVKEREYFFLYFTASMV